MKCVLLSVRPKWVAKILNAEQTVEIRKRFPSDYVGWVYIYCTKDSGNLLHKNVADIWWVEDKDFQKKNKLLGIEQQPVYNSKVVARFWCDMVEEIKNDLNMQFLTKTMNEEELVKKSCLPSDDDLFWYLAPQELKEQTCGYAIHITKLEIFDKPKELSEFRQVKYYKNCNKCPYLNNEEHCKSLPNCHEHISLTKAPQSRQYIEVEE